jgi:hypothetical protein
MTIIKVILIGDPLIRKKCAKVNHFYLPEVNTIKYEFSNTICHLLKIHNIGSHLETPLISNTDTSFLEYI